MESKLCLSKLAKTEGRCYALKCQAVQVSISFGAFCTAMGEIQTATEIETILETNSLSAFALVLSINWV